MSSTPPKKHLRHFANSNQYSWIPIIPVNKNFYNYPLFIMWIVNPEMLWQPSQQKYKVGLKKEKSFLLFLITGMGFWLFPTFLAILVHLFMDSYYFLPLKFKITSNSYCSHEIKRILLLGRKAVTNLDSILKSRDITLPTKAHLLKAMVFPIVIYGYESWTIKKAKRQRTDAFELWCWRKL